MDLARVEKALTMAAKAHRNQNRKQTDTPYITHPVAVAFILLQENCSEDLIIAGLLHDVVEDSPVGIEEITVEFGDKVAEIVRACTEPSKFMQWEKRKQIILQRIRSGSSDFKMVACADKLHNIESMIADYLDVGDRLWKRFSRGRDKQEWYYRSLAGSFTHGLDGASKVLLFEKYHQRVDLLFGEM